MVILYVLFVGLLFLFRLVLVCRRHIFRVFIMCLCLNWDLRIHWSIPCNSHVKQITLPRDLFPFYSKDDSFSVSFLECTTHNRCYFASELTPQGPQYVYIYMHFTNFNHITMHLFKLNAWLHLTCIWNQFHLQFCCFVCECLVVRPRSTTWHQLRITSLHNQTGNDLITREGDREKSSFYPNVWMCCLPMCTEQLNTFFSWSNPP